MSESTRPPHFLKEWRLYSKMNQKEFAEAVGLSHSNYNALELGKIGYTQKTLEQIASFLEIRPSVLLSHDPLGPDDYTPEHAEWHRFLEEYEQLSPKNQQMVREMVYALHSSQQLENFRRVPLPGDTK